MRYHSHPAQKTREPPVVASYCPTKWLPFLSGKWVSLRYTLLMCTLPPSLLLFAMSITPSPRRN